MALKLPKYWIRKSWQTKYGCVRCLTTFQELLDAFDEPKCPNCHADKFFLRVYDGKAWEPILPFIITCKHCKGSGQKMSLSKKNKII